MSSERSRASMTSFRLPVHLRETMRELAAERRITLTDAMVEAMALWIAREDRSKG